MKKIKKVKWVFHKQSIKHLSSYKFPKWALMVGISEDGDIYLPAVNKGHENVFKDICEDGSIKNDNGHYYFDANFIKKVYPNAIEVIDDTVKILREYGYFDFTKVREENLETLSPL